MFDRIAQVALIALFAIGCSAIVYAEVVIEVDIDAGSADSLTHWQTQYGTYVIHPSTGSTITITENQEVEIDPGVEVVFEGEYSLVIDDGSALTASGTAANPIRFTSDDSTAGAWGQIIFEGDNAATRAVGNFQYCTVEYGGDPDSSSYPDGAAILAYGYATLRVENSTIRYCDGTGLGAHYVGNPNPDSVYFNHNQIYQCNTGIKIAEHDSSVIEIKNNTILGMTIEDTDTTGTFSGMGIYIDGSPEIISCDIANNLIVNCETYGVYAGYIMYFIDNTIAHVQRNGVYCNMVDEYVDFKNNIVYGFSEGIGIDSVGIYSQNTLPIKYCCVYDDDSDDYWGGSVSASNCNNIEPGFVEDNASMDEPTDFGDYHLCKNDSLGTFNEGDPSISDPDGSNSDIGCYGGPAAKPFYWVYANNSYPCIDLTEISDTLDGDFMYRFGENCEVNTLRLVPSSDDFAVPMLEGAKITVNDSLLIGASAGADSVILAPLASGETWNCIQLSSGCHAYFNKARLSNMTSGIVCTGSNIELHIDDCQISETTNYGIFVSSGNPSLPVWTDLTLKNGLGYGIFSNGSDLALSSSVIDNFSSIGLRLNSCDGILSNVDISNCSTDGIMGYNTEFNLSHVTIADCGTNGINASQSTVNLEYGDISGCNTGISYTSCTSAGVIDTSMIEDNTFGVYLYASSPLYTRNTIEFNEKNGMQALSGSGISLGNGLGNYGNLFYKNGLSGNTSAECAEFYIYESEALFKFNNDFIDNNSGSLASDTVLIYYGWGIIGTPPTLNLKDNFFSGDQSVAVIPDNWFNSTNYLNISSVQFAPRDEPYRYSDDLDAIDLAMLCERQGNYEDASGYYWSAAVNDNVHAGLNGWARCQEALGTSDEDILEEFEDLLDDQYLSATAFWLQLPYQNRIGEYQESIDELDELLEVAVTYEDSAVTLLGQLATYLEMALAAEEGLEVNSAHSSDGTFNLPQLGALAAVVPADLEDYYAKRRALQNYMTTGRRDGRVLDMSTLPTEFALHQNFPNPFNPTTTLSFDLVRPETVKLSVYNIMGQEVAQLVNRPMQAGTHSVTFDASQLASGMYFYRIEAGAFTDMKRMVLVK